VDLVSAKELTDVYAMAGLKPDEVDHGCVHRYEGGQTVNIVVFEYSNFVAKEQGHYFSLGGSLFQGGAVLYAANELGDTIDMIAKPAVMFYRSWLQVEEAIDRGEVQRPYMAVNGKVIWRWPEPRPHL
jgi:hypothetical protein